MKKVFVILGLCLFIFCQQADCNGNNITAENFRDILLKYKVNSVFSPSETDKWMIHEYQEEIVYELNAGLIQLTVITDISTGTIVAFEFVENMDHNKKEDWLAWNHEKFNNYLPVVESIYGKALKKGKVSSQSPKDSPNFATLFEKSSYNYRLGGSQTAYDKISFAVNTKERYVTQSR